MNRPFPWRDDSVTLINSVRKPPVADLPQIPLGNTPCIAHLFLPSQAVFAPH